MTAEEIKITGQPTTDPQVCQFVVDRPLLPNGISIFCAQKEDGFDSLLVDELFKIEGIAKFYITGAKLSITKTNVTAWPEIGKKIGQAIRLSLTSPSGPVSEALVDAAKNWQGGELQQKIDQLFKDKINPSLASHGGFVEVSKIINQNVYLKLGGGCQGCASSLVTLKQGIEKSIFEAIPEVKHVVDDTDHAAGVNPYH